MWCIPTTGTVNSYIFVIGTIVFAAAGGIKRHAPGLFCNREQSHNLKLEVHWIFFQCETIWEKKSFCNLTHVL